MFRPASEVDTSPISSPYVAPILSGVVSVRAMATGCAAISLTSTSYATPKAYVSLVTGQPPHRPARGGLIDFQQHESPPEGGLSVVRGKLGTRSPCPRPCHHPAWRASSPSPASRPRSPRS